MAFVSGFLWRAVRAQALEEEGSTGVGTHPTLPSLKLTCSVAVGKRFNLFSEVSALKIIKCLVLLWECIIALETKGKAFTAPFYR